MESSHITLLGMTPEELLQVTTALDLPPRTARQIARWLYVKHVATLDEMTDLSLAARQRLSERYTVGASAPVEAQRSTDGTVKYLFRTSAGDFVESVYIPDGSRATLCVSSQVGCKMRCAFCMTGHQGFAATLYATDILNQIYSLPERDSLTNVVFMGQGEPFDNTDNVLRSLRVLTEDWGYAWSPKRITVSTVGLMRGLRRFLDESRCHLAVSLHNPFPAEREALMPAERPYPITGVLQLLRQYDFCRRPTRDNRKSEPHQRRLSFEYIVFGGVNDSRRHAEAVVRLLRDFDCRVNLIRFHAIPDTPLHGADEDTMLRFRDYLTHHGIFATIRASRGQDIFAACGLLSTARQQEARLSEQRTH